MLIFKYCVLISQHPTVADLSFKKQPEDIFPNWLHTKNCQEINCGIASIYFDGMEFEDSFFLITFIISRSLLIVDNQDLHLSIFDNFVLTKKALGHNSPNHWDIYKKCKLMY